MFGICVKMSRTVCYRVRAAASTRSAATIAARDGLQAASLYKTVVR
jgi:hypothetical protein